MMRRYLERLNFGFGPRLNVILQTEIAECGLACVGMIAGYFGRHSDIASLRREIAISMKGCTLGQLVHIARRLRLESRPLRVELDELNKLRLPCILHWNFDHFVVLKQVDAKGVVLVDPAIGERRITRSELSRTFTGVALELWPSPNFESKKVERRQFGLAPLLQDTPGLLKYLGHIFAFALSLEVFGLVAPLFGQLVLDDVLADNDADLLTVLALGFGILMLLQQAISVMRSWSIIHLSVSLSLQWRSNVFAHLIKLPVDYFMKRHLGDLLSRFGSVDQIQQTLTTAFISAVLDGLMSVATLGMMLLYAPMLALIAIVAMTLYGLLRTLRYGPLLAIGQEQIVATARQQSFFLETMRGASAIKLFQREELRRLGWLDLAVLQANAGIRMQKAQLLFQSANGLLFGIERILILWLGAGMVLNGAMTAGVLIAFIAFKEQFDSRVGSLIDKYYDLRLVRLQTDRLADIVLSEPEPDGIPEAAPEIAQYDIELADLAYRYGENDTLVLDGVNLAIRTAECVAIAGPSGCGKTTLANVLLGALKPLKGRVSIGGVDTGHMPLATRRGLFGSVGQEDLLLAGSIADNICFFADSPDKEWIERCAQLAAIHADICRMPMGYHTLVGDMGSALSGGQKQRILIARALYKRPRILVMDEATSHLDIENEAIVSANIKALNITRIVVAHRPETIAAADRVVFMRNGTIVGEQRGRGPAPQVAPREEVEHVSQLA